MKNLIQAIFLIALFGFFGTNNVFGQCGCTNCPLALPDGAVEDFFVNVNDDAVAAGDNCATATLQGINLNFDHEYLGDLQITMTAPNGTTVTLVGPVGFSGGSGTYDLTFVDGATQWVSAGQGSTTGNFSPNSGTIASLSAGGVCGTWTINVTDDQAVDSGNFFDFSLDFGGDTPSFACNSDLPPSCAPNCAASATASCSSYETAFDSFAGSYGEIQANGGESCFSETFDVTAAPKTVTQCFDYVGAAGSDQFTVLSGTSVVEVNSTNGTVDCSSSIDQIEIFDDMCNSLVAGGQGTSSAAVPGDTYTICVTGTAGIGTAEGTCEFSCMAHSVTPATAAPVCNANYSYSAMNVCSGATITFTEDSGACVEPEGSVVDPATPHLDLDWYLYSPGGTPGMAPAGYDPLAGVAVLDSYPLPNTDLIATGGLGGTWNGFVCADLDVTAPVNNTCDPITVTYFTLPWDRFYDTDGDTNFGEYGSSLCADGRYDVVIYPAAMSATITDDGSTCGTPTVTLVAGDGTTVCETETGAACTFGASYTTNFAGTATATALPASCSSAIPADVTINCMGCAAPCSADNGTW